MSDNKIVKLVLAAAFAAMTTVVTILLPIPIPATNGYINIGDSAVLLCAWIIGGPYGAIAAGVGSGLADYILGYGQYVPITTVVKFLMAFAAWAVYKVVLVKNKYAGFIASAVVAEIIMVAGYFACEYTILGYGLGALESAGSNAIQAVGNVVLGVVIISALEKSHALNIISRYIKTEA